MGAAKSTQCGQPCCGDGKNGKNGTDGQEDEFAAAVSSHFESDIANDSSVVQKSFEPIASELKLAFQLPDGGGTQDVLFFYKPLGLYFDKVSPVVIKCVYADTAGERNGVQVGWVLVKVNDEDVTEKPFKSIYELLSKGMSHLAIIHP